MSSLLFLKFLLKFRNINVYVQQFYFFVNPLQCLYFYLLLYNKLLQINRLKQYLFSQFLQVRSLEDGQLGDSYLGSLMHLQSSCWPRLQSSQGSTGAGNSAFIPMVVGRTQKTHCQAHSCHCWQALVPHHMGLSIGFSVSLQLVTGDPRESQTGPKMVPVLFIIDFTCDIHHLCCFMFVTIPKYSPHARGEGLYKYLNAQKQVSLAAIIGAFYHKSLNSSLFYLIKWFDSYLLYQLLLILIYFLAFFS